MSRGHIKGGTFERKMARELSQWWYGDPNYLWRRPGSGFRTAMPNRHTGDIVPIADVPLPYSWDLHVQLKRWKKSALKLDQLITHKNHILIKIWHKEEKEKREDLILILIVKADHLPELCVARMAELAELGINPKPDRRMIIRLDNGNLLTVFPWAELKKLKSIRVKNK